MENFYSRTNSSSSIGVRRLAVLLLPILTTYICTSRTVHSWSQLQGSSKFAACVMIVLPLGVGIQFFRRKIDPDIYRLVSILYVCIIFAIEIFANR